MKKKKKKKIKLRILPVFILLLIMAVIVGIVYLCTLLPIKNIYISGNNYISDQSIIEIAGIEDYPSFLKTTKSSIEKKLEKYSYISNVTVKKKLLASIYIEVEERNILFRKDEDNLIVLDDKTEIEDNGLYQLPILLNYVPDTKYDSFIKGMNLVNESIKAQISEILYYPNEQDEDRFLLYMNDGNYVYLTLTKFKQINYYEDVLNQLDGKKGILYLDSGNHFEIIE